MRKKGLSVLLALAVVLSLAPATVLADGAQEPGVQEIKVRSNGVEDGVPNADYQEAYTTAGLELSGPVDGVYTLTVDQEKLKQVVDAGKANEDSEQKRAYQIMENKNNPGKLWFGMEYMVPQDEDVDVKDRIKKASVQFDGGNAVLVELDNQNKDGFFNYIQVYDGQKLKPVNGETALIDWQDENNQTLAQTKAVVKVVFKESTFTVTFELDGGSGAFPALSVKSGEKVSEPSDKPTKEGHTFVGWYKDAGCTEKWDFAADTVTKEIKLYAKWEKESSTVTEYTITFDANGGTVSPASGKTKDGTLETLPNPTRSGYTFDGWYTAASGGTQVTTSYKFDKDGTIYAHWTQNSSSDPEEESYAIRIASGIRHGDVYTSHWYAEPGEWVTVTVYPDSDYEVDWVEVERSDGRLLWTDRSGNRYTFRMPASNVTVDARFTLRYGYRYTRYTVYIPEEPVEKVNIPSVSPVTWRPAAALWDVPSYSGSYPAAQWAYQNGYLDTAADGTLRLDAPVTHQQMWKIMAHWMGTPVTDARSITNWALQNGAAGGKSASAAMTRQNVVEYLYRCYFQLGGDVSVTGNLSGYRDSQLITSAASQNAWLWAVNKGIISGTADGYLNPDAVISRGDFAAVLMRLCQNVMG